MDLNTMETGIQLHSTYTFSSYLTENEPEQRVRILGYRLARMFDSRHPTPLVQKFFPQGKASEAVNRTTHLHLTSVGLDVQCLINSPVLEHCFPKAVRPLTLYYKINISNVIIAIIINIKD